MKEKINKPKAARKSSAGFFPAAYNGDVNKVRQLLDDGVNVNKKNKYSQTVLMEASVHGNLECLKLLLDRGANVNVRDRFGCSAVSYASMNGRVEALKLLLDHGGDINIKGWGKTSLMHVCERDHSACITLLLERGANMTLTSDDHGKTAYDYCKSDATRKMLTDAANKIDYVLK